MSYINVYTRTLINFKHPCLDHIFTKHNKIEAVLCTNITDHFSVILAIETKKETADLDKKHLK